MADFRSAPTAGVYETESDYETHSDFEDGFETEPPSAAPAAAKPLTKLTYALGAVVSVALVAGIGIWGYKLLVRDVSGIPVVRAVVGEMRVRPEEPGGQLARHQGLSVNVVAAEGIAGKPADRLKLAPKPVELAEEDQPISAIVAASEPQDTQEPEDETLLAEADPAPLEGGEGVEMAEIEDLIAQLAAGTVPMGEEPEEDAIEGGAAAATEPKVVAAVLDAPGVRNSLRPRKRPAEHAVIVPASLRNDTPAQAAATPEIDGESLPVGTRLVQLGAFDSPEIAREQWGKLQGRFADYMKDKSRVVQKATSGGRVFYRLRAHGFEDIADARRFCSTLVAERADCIPVVTR